MRSTLIVRLRHPAAYFTAITATPTTFVVPAHRAAGSDDSWQSRDSFVGSGPYVARGMRRHEPGPARQRPLRRRSAADRRDSLGHRPDRRRGDRLRGRPGRPRPASARSTPAGSPTTATSARACTRPRRSGSSTSASTPPGRRSTTPACAVPSPWPSTGRAWWRTAEGSGGTPASSVVPPALWPAGLEDDQATDLAEARRLLDEAGYTDRTRLGTITVNGTGPRRGARGRGLGERAGRPDRGRDDGVRDYLPALVVDPPQVFTINWIADYPSPYALYSLLLLPDATSNYGHWNDPRVRAAAGGRLGRRERCRPGGRLPRGRRPRRRRGTDHPVVVRRRAGGWCDPGCAGSAT